MKLFLAAVLLALAFPAYADPGCPADKPIKRAITVNAKHELWPYAGPQQIEQCLTKATAADKKQYKRKHKH